MISYYKIIYCFQPNFGKPGISKEAPPTTLSVPGPGVWLSPCWAGGSLKPWRLSSASEVAKVVHRREREWSQRRVGLRGHRWQKLVPWSIFTSSFLAETNTQEIICFSLHFDFQKQQWGSAKCQCVFSCGQTTGEAGPRDLAPPHAIGGRRGPLDYPHWTGHVLEEK